MSAAKAAPWPVSLALGMLMASCATTPQPPAAPDLAGAWDCIGGIQRDGFAYRFRARMSFERITPGLYLHAADGQANIESASGETVVNMIHRAGQMAVTGDRGRLELRENWTISADGEQFDGPTGTWDYRLAGGDGELVMTRTDDADTQGSWQCRRAAAEAAPGPQADRA